MYNVSSDQYWWNTTVFKLSVIAIVSITYFYIDLIKWKYL